MKYDPLSLVGDFENFQETVYNVLKAKLSELPRKRIKDIEEKLKFS